MLLAGIDPVALDYYAAKHVMLPLGGARAHEHNPDSFSGLINHIEGARDFINDHGGIGGRPTTFGDENIEVITASAESTKPADSSSGASGGSGGGGCFIATAAYGHSMAKQVIILQRLRDVYFNNNIFGRALVSAYYRHSPRLAGLIAKSPLMRCAVRAALYPLVWVAKAALTGKESSYQ
jgi:hypothetical protein